jgi:hypothetical protein
LWKIEKIAASESAAIFPGEIKYPEDRKIVENIFRTTAKLPIDKYDLVRDGIVLFINNFSINRGFIRLTVLADAQKFRQFLKIIGVPNKHVYISMFHQKILPTKEDISRQLEIVKSLDISPGNLISTGRRHIAGHHECSVAFLVARNDKLPERHKMKIEQMSLYGFRYALYLIAIGLGMRS